MPGSGEDDKPDEEIVAALLRMQLIRAREKVEFRRLTGGVSSDIWCVTTPSRRFCVKRALAKLKVAARKVKADAQGREHEVPLADWIDIGVFDEKDKPLYMQRQKVDSKEAEFTLTVDGIPAKAGIDPWNKLVDRSPDDNTTTVKRI